MDIARDQLETALRFMHEARKILFRLLHDRTEISRELVAGVDKLGLAFEFAENPGERICLCPACECHFYEVVQAGFKKCLSCDNEWDHSEAGETRNEQRQQDRVGH